jgi:septal ring factor EnvC (AmiA/AmiB activator)
MKTIRVVAGMLLSVFLVVFQNLSQAQTLRAWLDKVPNHPSAYEKARSLCEREGASIYQSIKEEIEREVERLRKIVDDFESTADVDDDENKIKSIDIEKLTQMAFDAEKGVSGYAKYLEEAGINSPYTRAVAEYQEKLEQEQKKLDLNLNRLDDEMRRKIRTCEQTRARTARSEADINRCSDEIRAEMKPQFIAAYNTYLAAVNKIAVGFRDKLKGRLLQAEEIIGPSASPQKDQGRALREAMVKLSALEDLTHFIEFAEKACCGSISRIWK